MTGTEGIDPLGDEDEAAYIVKCLSGLIGREAEAQRVWPVPWAGVGRQDTGRLTAGARVSLPSPPWTFQSAPPASREPAVCTHGPWGQQGQQGAGATQAQA